MSPQSLPSLALCSIASSSSQMPCPVVLHPWTVRGVLEAVHLNVLDVVLLQVFRVPAASWSNNSCCCIGQLQLAHEPSFPLQTVPPVLCRLADRGPHTKPAPSHACYKTDQINHRLATGTAQQLHASWVAAQLLQHQKRMRYLRCHQAANRRSSCCRL